VKSRNVSTPHNPLVSVITPVHNGAAFLHECIASVCAQTYGNWRYTILDNRSTDDTLPIARSFAARDPRIRVASNDSFLALVADHNRAMEFLDPQSTYCKPLMADDWLYPDCIEQLVHCALTRPTVGLVCSSAHTEPNKVQFEYRPDANTPYTYASGREAARHALCGERYFFGSPTTQLLRSDLVRKRDPLYNPDNLQADEEACYDLLRECDFGFVNRPLSYVRCHPASQTATHCHLFSLESSRVYALAKYGRDYLTEEEFTMRMDASMREYYARLALGAVELRGADFWAFHRHMLEMIGRPLDRHRLSSAVLQHVGHKLRAPSGVVRALAAGVAALSKHRAARTTPRLR
jgi:glycosyltransferase involved in cell wall biosynthesis